MFSKTFSLPRRGNGPDENEDAAGADPERGRFAVADGASESAFASLWARLLVAEFVRADGDAWDWLPALQGRWAVEVGDIHSWYAETKFQQGAFATFLGAEVRGDGWRAVAVGDSCLFHVRDGRLCRAFPLIGSAEFGVTPCLVASRGCDAAALERKGHRAEGEWRPGDCLWLMTDALAQWCLVRAEQSAEPWAELDALVRGEAPEDAFAEWVGRLRSKRQMRNDDVTALLVEH